MKKLIFLTLIIAFTGINTMSGAQTINAPKYRYAYSCDGFKQDRDDVAVSAMTLAIFDRLAMANQIVHYHFNTNFGGKPTHVAEHRKSVLETAVLFDIINEIDGNDDFFDVSQSEEELNAAIAHLAKEILYLCTA